ncbi:hypothetical protein OAG96_03720, partial [Akkermansiaceae bacterium]|nr:hypothetical protein [Akkermansiaceae bacterium]
MGDQMISPGPPDRTRCRLAGEDLLDFHRVGLSPAGPSQGHLILDQVKISDRKEGRATLWICSRLIFKSIILPVIVCVGFVRVRPQSCLFTIEEPIAVGIIGFQGEHLSGALLANRDLSRGLKVD